MNRRVAAYLRYSSTLQRPTSIDDQLRNIRRMLADEGDTLVEEYVFKDEAVSGTTEAGREGFQAMKAAILRTPPPVDALAVDDLSRLGRDQVDVGDLHKRLRFRGIELMAVAGFRSSAPSADLAFGVQTLLDQQYSRDLAHKTRRGLVGQAIRGNHKTDYRGYGCPSRKDRGPQACTNTLTISQAKLEEAVLDEIKRKLLDPAAIAFYAQEFKRAYEAEQKNSGTEKTIRKLEKESAVAQKKIDNLLDYLKNYRASPRVDAELRQAEAEYADISRRLDELRGEGTGALPLPPEKAIVDGLEHLRATLGENPAEAGRLLRALVGHLTMTPRYPEGWTGGEQDAEKTPPTEAEKVPFPEGEKGPSQGQEKGPFQDEGRKGASLDQETQEAGKGGPQERESRSPWYEVTGSAFLTNLLVPTAGMAFRGCGGGI